MPKFPVNILQLPEEGVNPALIANSGQIYSKDVAGITELFYIDSAGNVRQLTPPPSVPALSFGTYLPVLVNTSNLTASTAFTCQYSRVGNVVMVAGRVGVQPAVAGLSCLLNISLPIPSTLVGNDLSGVAAAQPPSVIAPGVISDNTTTAALGFIASIIFPYTYRFMFSYLILP